MKDATRIFVRIELTCFRSRSGARPLLRLSEERSAPFPSTATGMIQRSTTKNY